MESDPNEVKRLLEQIENLQLENNRLKQTQSKHIGLAVVGHVLDKSVDNRITDVISDEVFCEIVDVSKENFSNEETWLYVASSPGQCSNGDPTGVDLIKWLRHDVDYNRDYEFQVMKRMLVTKIEDLRQGSRRNNIDTRTFTRPKKQLSRPGLRAMVDSPLSQFRELMPQLSESMTLCENVDDTSMPFNSTYSSLSTAVGFQNTVLNANFQKHGERIPSTRFQLVENTRNILKLKVPGLKNSGMRRSEDTGLDTMIEEEKLTTLNSTFTKILSEPHLNTTTELRVLSPSLGRFGLDHHLTNSNPGALNATFTSDCPSGLTKPRTSFTNAVIQRTLEMNAYCQSEPDSPPSANGTFCVPNVRNGLVQKRAASCDSLDDDYSSQSDNSSSTNNRIVNEIGDADVQNIARLQEESLHIAMSTPRSTVNRDDFDDELPSPIHMKADINHGYHSDQSDHSSVAKSSRSSQLSSRSSSLRGSTNMLPTDATRLGAKLDLPKMKPVSAMLTGIRTKSRPASGLRAPTARTNQNAAVSGLPRPTTNIPRPSSRIPAPKVSRSIPNLPCLQTATVMNVRVRGRSTLSSFPRTTNMSRTFSRIPTPTVRKPAPDLSSGNKKSNWMEGCY